MNQMARPEAEWRAPNECNPDPEGGGKEVREQHGESEKSRPVYISWPVGRVVIVRGPRQTDVAGPRSTDPSDDWLLAAVGFFR